MYGKVKLSAHVQRVKPMCDAGHLSGAGTCGLHCKGCNSPCSCDATWSLCASLPSDFRRTTPGA